jgi:predicted KAP-like P-loop ATPase
MSTFNDAPIRKPDDDQFGIDGFAQALAKSITGMTSPEGSVIAVNGAWGAGKSSAINLILHHIEKLDNDKNIVVVSFRCWWFRGEDALALAFLQTLNATFSKTLPERFREILPKLGRRLLKSESILTPIINIASGGIFGGAAGAVKDIIGEFISDNNSVESQFQKLADELRKLSKRFLVVIDDIDRLTPDEALLIFRLIKSVGRLPNLIYLLAYDRILAERIVAERYPAEGPHYLEKIVQAPFELPQPGGSDLQNALLNQFEKLCGAPSEDDIVRFMNIFYDVVAPLLRTPRDVARLINAISVTWPAVKGEVDRADFLAIEAWRVFLAKFYRNLRYGKDLLCGVNENYGQIDEKKRIEIYERKIFDSMDEANREQLKIGLKRLFPRLQGIWGNMGYGAEWIATWPRKRLVCTKDNFETYFRFSLGEDVLSVSDIKDILEHAASPVFVREFFEAALKVTRKSGQTRASLALEALAIHAKEISEDNVEPFLKTLFAIADDVDVPQDKARGFGAADNMLRLHWLLNQIFENRFDQEERSEILVRASSEASLRWLVDLSCRCWDQLHEERQKNEYDAKERLVNEKTASELRALALDRLTISSRSGDLVRQRELVWLLFRWRDLVGSDSNEVRGWIDQKLVDDEFVIGIARSGMSASWSQGMGLGDGLGDRVARRLAKVYPKALESLMDLERLKSRMGQILESKKTSLADREEVRSFLDAWDKENNKRGRNDD